MQRRRFLSLTTAGVAAVTTAPGLTACGGGSGSDGDVTLKVVAADYGDSTGNSSQKYWDRLTRAFETKNSGIKVDVTVYGWTDVDRRVAEMVKSGQAPDIAQIGAYADYAAQGKLYRADELLAIPTQAGFISSIAHAGEVRRVQYGVPFVASARLLFYNKKLFDRAGISSAPTSWNELKEAAVQLKADGVKIPYGLPLGPEECQAETMMWMLSGGGGYADPNGSYTIDSTENIETFEWLRDELVGAGLTGPGSPARTNRQDTFDAFTRGEVGMLNGHPTLMQQASGHGISYGTAPLPGRKGRSSSTMGVADWLMAFKHNGHRKEIGKFLDFVYTEKNVLDFVSEYDLLPVTTAVERTMLGDSEYKRLWRFLDELESAEFYPADKTSWAEVSKLIKEKIGSTVAKGGDPTSVLGQIQREADAMENAGA
ncbi:extracellular solute-binding protein [Streptomyces malaysiensis]|uniref:Extracellular solute-binding protein n=1 Tax=Streptomyces malaysiensis TaxID=92644 RepID=A0ABX6W7P1_STRMQ|nr:MULTISPECIES: extracellular solute-binding protein [Streptomyces]MYX54295.1 extracellular solute-binding protein [Streptomyces sp. SID8382]AUA13010.1 sn-glycerol-3-phosphate-binding periplasmic protein UgpB precursor [Streptomyces sp. M56]MCM3805823.1 extracellular solute-binding protein [Streptomyces sp. DR7-3]QPI57076.1 extracellular solute-binding protein [Streptomyces solisilvae]UHH18614.1 extracellular solute-binding protein [Streptomyces sp. HNM0561]